MTRLRFVLIIVTCVGMSLGSVFAQNGGTVRGQITDLTPTQDPIEGVEVKIVAQDGNKEWTTTTDAKGEYKHAGLPPGRYLISISKDGYDERRGKPVSIVEGGDHFVPLKMSKKGRIELFKVQPTEKMNIIVKQRIVALLQRAAESVSKRYDLDEADVKTLHWSIEGALEQGGDLSTFAKPVEEGNMSLLEMLLSHPGCKAAFAKHLGEAQFQEYLDFTAARRQRDRQAVVHWLTVALDKELSLTADQRETVMQSLLDKARSEAFPNAMNALRISSQQAAQLAHYRLKVSLDGALSETQSKVWQGLINANAKEKHIVIRRKAVEAEKGNEKEGADVNKKRPLIRKAPTQVQYRERR